MKIKDVYSKDFKTYQFDGIWRDLLGDPEAGGAWLIWGEEKQGKTWFALKLANMLSRFNKTLYISAEEGLDSNFRNAMIRAGLSDKNKKLMLSGYISISVLEEKLKGRKAPKILFFDNLTIYNEEMKYGKFRELLEKNRDKLFIFLAHEENRKPFTTTAKMCKRLAKIIIHVNGLTAFVGGRCPGGLIGIDENTSSIIWGVNRF